MMGALLLFGLAHMIANRLLISEGILGQPADALQTVSPSEKLGSYVTGEGRRLLGLLQATLPRGMIAGRLR